MEEVLADLPAAAREWVNHRSAPISVEQSLMRLCHLSETRELLLLPEWLNQNPNKGGEWLAYPVRLESRACWGRSHKVVSYLCGLLSSTGLQIGSPVEERWAAAETPLSLGQVAYVQSALLDDDTMLWVRIDTGGDGEERLQRVMWTSGGEERQVFMMFERSYKLGCDFCIARLWWCNCKRRVTAATPRPRGHSPVEFFYFVKACMTQSWFVNGIPMPEGSSAQCGPSPAPAFSAVIYNVNHLKESSRFELLDEHLAKLDKSSPRILSIHDSSASSGKAGTGAGGPERSWCKDCGKSFSRRFDLQRHVYAVHKGEKKLQCSLCPRKFAVQQNLMTHIANVHERRRSTQCPTCGVEFSTRYKMNQHARRVHQNERCYACTVCGYSCFQRSDLQRHMGRVHGATSSGGSSSDVTSSQRGCLTSAGSAGAETFEAQLEGRLEGR